MDDVRLTPAERRALELIEAELRKDRDLDRAMRRMRVPRTGRRPLRRRGSADDGPAEGSAPEGSAAPDECAEAPDFPFAASAASAAARHRERRRVWALALVLSIVFAALLTAGTLFFLVFALVLVTLAASAGVVWMAVSFYLRKPDPG
ncbi:hypothetical protein OG216_11975 [Streptomycetaceae bacterium NBC_01309]